MGRRASVAEGPPPAAPQPPQSAAERLRNLVEADRPKKGPGCTVCALDADLRAAIEELRHGGHAYTTISRNLKDPAIGVVVSPQTLGYHFLQGHADAR